MQKEYFMQKDYIFMAKELGFCDAVIIPVRDIKFNHSFRQYCEQNDCGFYNQNYACPPYCGTPEEMENKVKRFKKALVLRTNYEVENAMDQDAMNPLKKMHTNKTLELIRSIQQGKKENYLGIMAGPCNYCENCRQTQGKPCEHPDMCFSCLSAYCIDVTKLALRCKMTITWDLKSASFFSIYLYEEDEECEE